MSPGLADELACLGDQASESCVLRVNKSEREGYRTRTRMKAGHANSSVDEDLQNSSVGALETPLYSRPERCKLVITTR